MKSSLENLLFSTMSWHTLARVASTDVTFSRGTVTSCSKDNTIIIHSPPICTTIVAYRREEFGRGLREDLHHGGGVGEKQGHTVGQLISDLDVGILLGQLHAVEGTAVVGEVVLNGGVHHLTLYEL